MHVKVLITTLLLTLTILSSFHTHGTSYVVILEIDNSTEAPILLREQLFQQWHQLSLIPLPKGTELTNNTLADMLAKHLPEVIFTEQLAKDNTPIYTAYGSIPNGVRSYISWLVNTSSYSNGSNDQPPSKEPLINNLFERLTPSPQIRGRVFSTPIPDQNLIAIRLPEYSDAWNFRLYEIKNQTGGTSYVITPILQDDIDTPLPDDTGTPQPNDIDPPLQDEIDTLTTQFKAMSLPDVHHNKLYAPRPPRAKTPQGKVQIIPGPRPPSPFPIALPKIQLELTNEDRAFHHVLHGEDYHYTADQLQRSVRQRPELLGWQRVKTLQGGKSEFGAVQIYKPKPDGPPIVIKKIKEKHIRYRNLARETAILQKLRHNNIIAFEGMALRPTSGGGKELWMALTYMPDGDMEDLIDKSPRLLTNDNIKIIMQSLVDAVLYLHRNNIIHRDIKPGNILLVLANDKVVQVKLSDFGFVAATDNPANTQGGCGSAEYAPPELLWDQPRYYLKELDIWPIGVTLFASYVGLDIYPDSHAHTSDETVRWRRQNPDLEVASPKSLQRLLTARNKPPKSVKKMIEACCQPDPKDRPNIFALSQTPYIQSSLETKLQALRISSGR